MAGFRRADTSAAAVIGGVVAGRTAAVRSTRGQAFGGGGCRRPRARRPARAAAQLDGIDHRRVAGCCRRAPRTSVPRPGGSPAQQQAHHQHATDGLQCDPSATRASSRNNQCMLCVLIRQWAVYYFRRGRSPTRPQANAQQVTAAATSTAPAPRATARASERLRPAEARAGHGRIRPRSAAPARGDAARRGTASRPRN